MKKLLLVLFFGFLALAGFGQTYATLNGIAERDAVTWIRNFPGLSLGEANPQRTNVWFSRQQVINIARLLDGEKSSKKTDGVRVYFFRDPADGTTSPHNNKIALVSTKDNDTHRVNGVQYLWHLDYYDHDSSADLFHMPNTTMADLQGVVNNGIAGGGAVLYTPCPECKDDPRCDFKKLHFRKRKAAEVMVSNFGKHSINTYSAWFDLDFIDYLASTLQNKPTHSGIRIYFATHSADDSDDAVAGRDTFVITTTDGVGSYKDTDYFDCDDPVALHKQQTIKKKNIKLKSRIKTNIPKKSPPMDKGELCPDNCNS